MTQVRIQHASMQRDDPRDQQAADVDAIFQQGGDFIGLTEVGPAENKTAGPLLRQAALDHGYRLWLPAHYGEGIAVRQTLGTVTGFGVTRPFVRGVGGQYPDRGARWVTVGVPGVGRVCYIVWHTNPADNRADRHATNVIINTGVASLTRRKGKGSRIVFASCDDNVDDATDNHPSASTAPLRQAGMVSCWDERGQWPNTLGSRTVDVIWRYRPDARVHLTAARRLPRRHSDHAPIEAVYDIRPPAGVR